MFRSKSQKVCLCGGMQGPTPPESFDADIRAFVGAFPLDTPVIYGGVTTGLLGRVAASLAVRGVSLEGALIPEERTHQQDHLARVHLFDSYDDRQDYMFSVASVVYFLPGGLGTFHEFFTLLLRNKELKVPKEIILLNWLKCWEGARTLLTQAEHFGFLKAADLTSLQWRE